MAQALELYSMSAQLLDVKRHLPGEMEITGAETNRALIWLAQYELDEEFLRAALISDEFEHRLWILFLRLLSNDVFSPQSSESATERYLSESYRLIKDSSGVVSQETKTSWLIELLRELGNQLVAQIKSVAINH